MVHVCNLRSPWVPSKATRNNGYNGLSPSSSQCVETTNLVTCSKFGIETICRSPEITGTHTHLPTTKFKVLIDIAQQRARYKYSNAKPTYNAQNHTVFRSTLSYIIITTNSTKFKVHSRGCTMLHGCQFTSSPSWQNIPHQVVSVRFLVLRQPKIKILHFVLGWVYTWQTE